MSASITHCILALLSMVVDIPVAEVFEARLAQHCLVLDRLTRYVASGCILSWVNEVRVDVSEDCQRHDLVGFLVAHVVTVYKPPARGRPEHVVECPARCEVARAG